MKKKGKILAPIFTIIAIIVGTIFGALQIGKAEDTAGEITLTKTAVATTDRKAKVTLEIHTSELKQSTAEIIFVLDHSSSMNEEACLEYETKTYTGRDGKKYEYKACTKTGSRLDAAQKSAVNLVNELIPTSGTGNVKVGFVSFGTYYESNNSISLTNNKTAVINKINSLKEVTNNGTNVHGGLKAAKDQLASSKADTKIIILLSDGKPTFFYGEEDELCGNGQTDSKDNDEGCDVVTESGHVNKPSDVAEETATALKSSPINAEIYAIGFGSSANDIASFLKNQIASTATEEKTYAYSATETSDLEEAFAKIASNIKNTLATNATVTDTIPESFSLTEEAKAALQATYGDDITIIENEDGTTTIKVNYDEISSVQGTYVIEYEVIADEDHYGAMYTNVEATFTATATEDNTFYQDKNINMTFDKPAVAISSVTKDDDYTTTEKYIAKEGKSITIDVKDTILNNDSVIVHTDKPSTAITNSRVTDKIVIENQPTCGTFEVQEDGTFTYTATEGCAGDSSEIYEIKYHVVSTVVIDSKEYIVTSNTSTIKIKVEKSETAYSVKYLEKGTDKELAETKNVTDKYVYDTVKETAKDITGYNLAEGEKSEKELKLSENSNSNVIIFYYTIKPAQIEDPTFTKVGPDSITSATEAVDYEITYKTTISDYKGKATITLVDTLPYTLDESKSNELDGGTYNAENKTITWVIEKDIDTYTNGDYELTITKNISVFYNYPEFTGNETEVSNTVSSSIKVDTADEEKDEITEDTPIDIKGKLVVEHLYINEEGQEVELTTTQPATEEKVGTPYETSPIVKNGFKVKVTPANAKGVYKEGTTTVTYYYERVEAEISEPEINKTAETEEITSSKDKVTYNVNYKTTIKEYNGPVTITIVDTLPYEIDLEKSIIDSGEYKGTYNATNKTITWVIEQTVNTYENVADGDPSNTQTIDISLEYTVVYKDLDATADKVTNSVSSTINVETTDPKESDDKEDIPVNIKGNVITHHVDESGNTLSSDVKTEDKVGKDYKTTSVEIDGYELKTTPTNANGKYIEGTIEVTYVYKRLGATPKNPVVTKTGTTEITSSTEATDYTITYDAIVENYTGNITVTIVDTLPYALDESKENDLAGGTYNAENKTITWVETIENEDASKDINIDITKTIKVFFKNIDASTKNYTNKVEVTLADDIEETEDTKKEATHETDVNIQGNVTAYYYVKGTQDELANSESSTDKVGTNYETKAKDIEGYELVSTPSNATGKYTEQDIEVIYEYTRIIADIEDEKLSKTSVLEEITASNILVDYQIVYNAKIVDYKGTATIKVVDKLPYAIDVQSSQLAGGKYDAATKTITWTETIEGINTFQNGAYNVNFTKDIVVKYKDIASDKPVVNKVEGSIKTDTKNSDGKEAEEEIVAAIKGDLIVKHIYKDKDGNEKVLETEPTKTDYVGYQYTTDSKKFNGYTLDIIPENATGTYTEEDTIVIYYYKRVPAEVKENILDKKSTSAIVTNINDAFKYTISYKTTLNEYEGKAIITIVDHLTYEIDEEKSNIAGGVYDKEKLTITWTKEYDVNTYDNKNNTIEENINITLYYKDLSPETRIVINNATSKLELETTDPVETTDKVETNLEVKGTVKVNYIDELGNSLTDSIILTDLVGEKYTTEQKEFEGYIFSKITGSKEGKYIDGEIEVTYIYEIEGTGSTEYEEPLPPQTNIDSKEIYITLISSITLVGLILTRKMFLN